MNEAYKLAMQYLKLRCETHKTQHGEYPTTMTINEERWEVLRAGMHAKSDASYLVIPMLEDQPISTMFAINDAIRPLHMVKVMKEEKTKHAPRQYDSPVTIRWQTAPSSEWQEFTSSDPAKLEAVHSALYEKYASGKLAHLEVKAQYEKETHQNS